MVLRLTKSTGDRASVSHPSAALRHFHRLHRLRRPFAYPTAPSARAGTESGLPPARPQTNARRPRNNSPYRPLSLFKSRSSADSSPKHHYYEEKEKTPKSRLARERSSLSCGVLSSAAADPRARSEPPCPYTAPALPRAHTYPLSNQLPCLRPSRCARPRLHPHSLPARTRLRPFLW